MSGELKLYVWSEFCPDYKDGLAFAIAESPEEAQRLVIEAKSYEPLEWGLMQVFDLSSPVAFCVSGGG